LNNITLNLKNEQFYVKLRSYHCFYLLFIELYNERWKDEYFNAGNFKRCFTTVNDFLYRW